MIRRLRTAAAAPGQTGVNSALISPRQDLHITDKGSILVVVATVKKLDAAPFQVRVGQRKSGVEFATAWSLV